MERRSRRCHRHCTSPGFGAINGKLYIAGGYAIRGLCSNTLYIYDIDTDTWTIRSERATGCRTTLAAPCLTTGLAQTLPVWRRYTVELDGLTNITQIYDPDSRHLEQRTEHERDPCSGAYGTAVGNDSIVAPGGLDANFIGLNDNEQLINIPCGTPTPTPTPSATATPTATADAYGYSKTFAHAEASSHPGASPLTGKLIADS